MNKQIEAVFDYTKSYATWPDGSQGWVLKRDDVMPTIEMLIERGILAKGPAWEDDG